MSFVANLSAVCSTKEDCGNANNDRSDECVRSNVLTRQSTINVEDMTKKSRNQDCSEYNQQKISKPKFPWIRHCSSPLLRDNTIIDRLRSGETNGLCVPANPCVPGASLTRHAMPPWPKSGLQRPNQGQSSKFAAEKASFYGAPYKELAQISRIMPGRAERP
jgi:hypothetical protein